MLKKKNRLYIKNKLNNCIKIKKNFKLTIIKSLVHNNSIQNKFKAIWLIRLNNQTLSNTTINDVCMISSVLKKSSKHVNLARHEFHKLCRSNKLTSYVINSW